ncbi:MAG: orotidine-5'-phosphate decarboxylase [Desulfurobacteriaceae bacterium]
MLIVALDFDGKEKALKLVKELGDSVKYYKVGLELFSRAGIDVVREISSMGKKVFLDLKYHDIPNTVKSAARVAVEARVFMYNLHALGGFELMREVAEFNREYAEKLGIERPLLIAVTVLTSMKEEDLKEVGIEKPLEDEVLRLAELAKRAGLDGVVCSAKEVSLIKNNLGKDFITVTPGIRPLWAAKDDQKRVVTPKMAKELGTDFIVVGRPITRAENPKEAAERILEELQ